VWRWRLWWRLNDFCNILHIALLIGMGPINKEFASQVWLFVQYRWKGRPEIAGSFVCVGVVSGACSNNTRSLLELRQSIQFKVCLA